MIGEGDGSDEEVEYGEGFAELAEGGAEAAELDGGGGIEFEDVELLEEGLEAGLIGVGSLAVEDHEPEFGDDGAAEEAFIAAKGGEALPEGLGVVAEEAGGVVGVKEIAGHRWSP